MTVLSLMGLALFLVGLLALAGAVELAAVWGVLLLVGGAALAIWGSGLGRRRP
jgi:hypothetical protein